MPGTSIHPEPAVLCPLFCFSQLLHCLHHYSETNKVSPMWIGEIPGSKDLVWTDPLEQCNGKVNIHVGYRIFHCFPCFIKREGHEMYVTIPQPCISCTCNGFS